MRSKLLAAVAFVLLSALAYADGLTVYQENKKFSESEVTVKQGQSVTFTNHDTVTHNVFSSTSGMEFDLRTQQPGQSSTVTFDHVGEAEVMCAIHPQMKMKVKVVP
jgi:plastocyanin